MNAWVRDSKAGKSLFAIAVLLALSLRILIPTGFMPTVTSHGIVVELCSGMSGKTVTIDIGKKSTGNEGQHTAESPCAFAAGLGHGLISAADLPTILPFVYGLTIFVGTAIADLTISRLAAPPPPSQGPPALS
jgi:hypothetical protein